jgi:nucleotide-binding universal stress UspA family protein
MVEIKNILCAVDFSEISPRVASYTETLAKALNAKVHVIFVAPNLEEHSDFDFSLPEMKNFVGEIITNSDKIINTFIQENLSTVDAVGKVLEGETTDKILNFSESENIDLIIMGTHGRRGVKKIIFGSVAEKVVKSAKVPVLTIRPN